MNRQLRTTGAALALLITGAANAATLDLRFKDPEKFADIGWGSIERERHLEALRDEFQRQAARLPEGQRLQVEVTQVDLAGWVPPASTTPVRVLRGRADWPRIDLRYTLRQGQADDAPVLREGEARIADMNYLQRSPRVPEGNQSLGYERQMLNRWFTETFPEASPRRTAGTPARAASNP